MEKWKKNWPGDLIDRMEEVRDFADSVYGAYFNYTLRNDIDLNDRMHPINKNRNIANQIKTHSAYSCQSSEELNALDEQLNDLLNQLIEYKKAHENESTEEMITM